MSNFRHYSSEQMSQLKKSGREYFIVKKTRQLFAYFTKNTKGTKKDQQINKCACIELNIDRWKVEYA
jgi:hypothetical protein